MKKRLIFCLVVASLPLVLTSCGEQYTITDGTDGLVYELNSKGDGYVVTSCITIESDIVIPELYDNLPVREIGEAAFRYDKIDSIVLPKSLRKIGNEAFLNITPATEGSLTSIVIPEGVEEIGDKSFYYCHTVKEITLPKTLKSIGTNAFGLNANLSKFYLEGGQSDYFEVSGNVLYTKGKTELVCYPRGVKQTTYDLPETVEVVREGAMYGNTYLTSINFKNGNKLREIGPRGFGAIWSLDDCDISRCTNLKVIGEKAFSENKALKQMVVPESVETMGDGVFYSCSSLLLVQFKNKFTKINNDMFEACSKLQNVTFADANMITEIGESAFSSTSLTRFPNLPNLVSIGKSAFNACMKLSSVSLPAKLTTIGESAFSNCTSITSVTFPNNLEEIPYGSFWRCEGLQEIDLSNTKVHTIGKSAFMNCSSVSEISFPSTLRVIDDMAFAGLHLVKTLDFNEGLESIGSQAFDNYRDLYKVYIPASVNTIMVRAFAGMQGRQDLQIFYEGDVIPSKWAANFVFYVTDIDIHCNASHNDFVQANYVYRTRKITLDQTQVTLAVNESVTLGATVTTVNESEAPTIPGITWTSSDDSIATVDENGVVTAKKSGTVTITATAKDNGANVSCTVTVK